ncbi:GTP cyclohydrolase, FolE2/MptA family, partial [Alcaligenes faecalis]|uniref:GTP cyclohydrolase, FolE2/MptA family n=2 Tax=Alcaligenes TaxID=507 RepID=UPI001E554005
IDRIEESLATPLQTAAKRADEQAFAALNGQNLMFVEDAARRIEAALGDYQNPGVQVRHLESLHPHDAVAFKTP